MEYILGFVIVIFILFGYKKYIYFILGFICLYEVLWGYEVWGRDFKCYIDKCFIG